jgi:hypothetical protein
VKTATLSEAAFDAAAAAAGLELSPDDRAIALAEARKLHRSAARVRAYVAAAECTRPT